MTIRVYAATRFVAKVYFNSFYFFINTYTIYMLKNNDFFFWTEIYVRGSNEDGLYWSRGYLK